MSFGQAAALSLAFVLGAAFATAVILGPSLLADRPAPFFNLTEESPRAPDEKPFFSVGKRTEGPLTLDELQINIPAELDSMMTDETRACFLRKIGELAAKAGDPETLDPAEVAYLPTDGSWDDLTIYARRGILAQAVISRAIALC
ncbi:MAG: hypothetical protein AAGE80_11040 [Pseudomonadota bacterium]